MIRSARLLPLVPGALLGACATPGDYPSLAQRPAERVEGTLTPDDAPPVAAAPAPPSADLVQRLAALRRSAEALHAEFTRSVPAAQRLVNAAGASGTDSWAAAQVALADLDSLRSRAAVPLADLDALWVDATVDDTAREAIGTARASVEALIASEDAVLARLRSRL